MTLQDFLKLSPEDQWKEMVLLRQQMMEQRKIAWRLCLGNIFCIIAVVWIHYWTIVHTPTFAYQSRELKDLPSDTLLIVAEGKKNTMTGRFDYLLIVSGSTPTAVRSSHTLPIVFTVQQHGSTTRIIDLTKQEQQQPPVLGPEI